MIPNLAEKRGLLSYARAIKVVAYEIQKKLFKKVFFSFATCSTGVIASSKLRS
jgi:hypothetical protein